MATRALALYSTANPYASSTALTSISACASLPMRHRVRSSRRDSTRACAVACSLCTALPTVTAPSLHSLLCFTFGGHCRTIPTPLANEPLELAPAFFIILEHVVAQAGGQKEHHVTRRAAASHRRTAIV